MSSEDSDSDPDIPDVAECQKLCEQFTDITGTDVACAQFYLQDRKWNLDISVNDFFEDRSNKGAIRVNDKNEAQVVVVLDGSSNGLAAAATAVIAESAASRVSGTTSHWDRKRQSVAAAADVQPEKQPKSVLKFITWNIDGLCEKNLALRTKAVCQTILEQQADIVFLQEVVPESAEYILKTLTDYHCLFGNEVGYFTGTLLKKSTIFQKEFQIIDFENTRMMRNALKVNVTFSKKSVCLFNSHLESTAEGADERKEQLKLMFQNTLKVPEDHTVIFAGDLNLREKELQELGGLPALVEDVWVSCGRRKECSYTWDMTRNDNLEWQGRFKPRARYDRVYLRPSRPGQLRPVYFGLIGLERLLPHRCFPSDHWGLVSHFELKE